MKTIISFYLAILLIFHLNISGTYSQPLTGYTFNIVNMMPNPQSNEIDNDAETNIAVNPSNTLFITGSAFTLNPTGSTTSAPIYVSVNGGTTWSLNNIVPSANGWTGDISLGFANDTLYAGILRGGSWLRCMMLRAGAPTSSAMMTTLVDRSSVQVDQPWVSAMTVNDAMSTPRDRVFSGDNLYQNKKGFGGSGKTAEVMFSNDAASAPFPGFTNPIVEVRNTFEQDMPAIRTAIHSSGVVYAVFYSWISGSNPSCRCDVVVVRDNNFATGVTPFTALTDAGDTQAGQKVVSNVLVPAFPASLGNNRLVASNLAIAVDPNNSANVIVGWCDRVGSTDYTVHFRRSTDSGQAWESSDWLTVTNATNPGIAITTNGKVGLIYQQLTGSGSSQTWETHFRFTTLTGTTFTDDILSKFLDSDLITSGNLSGFLGDYLRIQAVGGTFYGVFPAGNRADNANFPLNVTYQRNADFGTKQLRNVANTSNVSVSVDPFFFSISPLILNICKVHPEICHMKFIDKFICRIPPYPCVTCPCLSCPPFEINFEEIYKEVFIDKGPETVLLNPYFHLMLDGYDPQNFDIKIMTRKGGFVAQELNKTDKGYAISFHPSKNNYSKEKGVQGLIVTVLPKTEAASKKGAEFNYKLQVSDYRFKEFSAMQK